MIERVVVSMNDGTRFEGEYVGAQDGYAYLWVGPDDSEFKELVRIEQKNIAAFIVIRSHE